MLINRGPWKRKEIKGWMKSLEARESLPPIYDVLLADSLAKQGFKPEYKPASLVDLDQLFQALELFSPEHDVRVDFADPSVAEGMKMAWKVFARPEHYPKLRPIALIDTPKYLKLNKSAGLTALHQTKGEALEYGLSRAGQILAGKKSPNPVLAAIRSQAKEPLPGEEYIGKTRLVWAYPAEMTIIEAMYAPILYEVFKRKRTTMMFGKTKCDVGCLVDSFVKNSGDCVYGLDYSKFDSSIPSGLIRYAFKIIKTWFDADDVSWDTVVKYFLHTPIVMPDGNLYSGKKHGVPSGSYFTQLIDSIVNTILIGAMSHHFGMRISWRNFFVLGDDVIMSTYKGLDLHQVADYLLSTFGIVLHPTKCEINKAHFLGADWPVVTPQRALQELVNKAVYPERYRIYNGESRAEKDLQAIMILLSYSKTYYNAWRLVPLRANMGCYNDGTIQSLFSNEEDVKHLSGYMRLQAEYLDDKNRITSYTLQGLG